MRNEEMTLLALEGALALVDPTRLDSDRFRRFVSFQDYINARRTEIARHPRFVCKNNAAQSFTDRLNRLFPTPPGGLMLEVDVRQSSAYDLFRMRPSYEFVVCASWIVVGSLRRSVELTISELALEHVQDDGFVRAFIENLFRKLYLGWLRDDRD